MEALSEWTAEGRLSGSETGGSSGLTVLMLAPGVTGAAGLGCTTLPPLGAADTATGCGGGGGGLPARAEAGG